MTTNSDTVATLRPNHPIPGFALPDANGATMRLAAFKQRRPVLLALLHSANCPHCRAWLAGLDAAREELNYRCVHPLFIFPDDRPTLQALQQEMNLPGALLSDPSDETRARYLGARAEQDQHERQSVLLIAVGRYNELLDVWVAHEPSEWPPLSEPLAAFAFAEQEDCACGLPIWPEASS